MIVDALLPPKPLISPKGVSYRNELPRIASVVVIPSVPPPNLLATFPSNLLAPIPNETN
nr:MAG TPA: hypothetical protein [Caudoviricetes sp.]